MNQIQFLNIKTLLLLVISTMFFLLVFSSCNFYTVNVGDKYLTKNFHYASLITIESTDIINIKGQYGLNTYEENGKWSKDKDTLFFFQHINIQKPYISLVNDNYSTDIVGTRIRIIEHPDSNNRSNKIFIAKFYDNIIKKDTLCIFKNNELVFYNKKINEICIRARLNEYCFDLKGNDIIFYYTNYEHVLESFILPQKYLIKRNKLISIKDNGELDSNEVFKKIKK